MGAQTAKPRNASGVGSFLPGPRLGARPRLVSNCAKLQHVNSQDCNKGNPDAHQAHVLFRPPRQNSTNRGECNRGPAQHAQACARPQKAFGPEKAQVPTAARDCVTWLLL